MLTVQDLGTTWDITGPKARKQFWHEKFEELETEGAADVYRVMLCYRVVRELVRIRGLLDSCDLLSDLVGIEDIWFDGSRFTPTPVAGRYPNVCFLIMKKGVGLIPDPSKCLDAYFDTFVEIINSLRIGCTNPKFVLLGTQGIEIPQDLGSLFPSLNQIVRFEESLVQQVGLWMIEEGEVAAEENMRSEYGFTYHEAQDIKKAARKMLQNSYEIEIEESRAIMIARLDTFIARARDSLDLRAELGGLRQMTIVLGLGANKPMDEMKEIHAIVAAVSKRRIAAPPEKE